MTVTICPPPGEGISPSFTFPIALGQKGADHSPILEMFFTELGHIRQINQMYSSKQRSSVSCIADVSVYMGDRPERFAFTSTLSYNSNISRVLFATLDPNLECLPSCHMCLRRSILRCRGGIQVTSYNCNICCDWNIMLPAAGAIKIKDYPDSLHPQSPSIPDERIPRPRDADGFMHLPPFKSTVRSLVQAANCCFFNVAVGHWLIGRAQCFLRLNLIPKSCHRSIIGPAIRLKRENPNVADRLCQSDVGLFFTCPGFWKAGIQLSQCIETPLHHIPLGIVNRTYSLIAQWLSSLNLRSGVGRISVLHMEQMRSHLQVDWYQIVPFGGGTDYTTGGWVGDQNLAFARYLPSFAAIVRQVAAKKGINESHPRGGEVALVCSVCDALICLVSRLLTRIPVTTGNIDDHVKLFLSCVHKLDDTVNAANQKNLIKDTANYLSLLNLPEQIRRYGPLHLYWEGNRERFIQELKPMLLHPRWTASFFNKRHQQLYCESQLLEVGSHLNGDDFQVNNNSRLFSAKAYKDKEEVVTLLLEGSPIVAALIPMENAGEQLCVLHKSGRRDYLRLRLLPLLCNDSRGVVCENRFWCPVTADDSAPSTNKELCGMESFVSLNPEYCVLTPLPGHCDTVLYNVSTVEWKVRSQGGQYGMPIYSGSFP